MNLLAFRPFVQLPAGWAGPVVAPSKRYVMPGAQHVSFWSLCASSWFQLAMPNLFRALYVSRTIRPEPVLPRSPFQANKPSGGLNIAS